MGESSLDSWDLWLERWQGWRGLGLEISIA